MRHEKGVLWDGDEVALAGHGTRDLGEVYAVYLDGSRVFYQVKEG